MKSLKYPLLFIVITALFCGCRQKGLSDYSSPLSTYETYLDQAATLRVVADHRHYRRAIRCFTKENRSWFKKNYDNIPADREEGVYENLYRTKKEAYVFGRSVVLAGPSPENEEYSVVEKDEDSARIEVEGYEHDINLIKIDDSWEITDLFGIKESAEQ